MHNMKTGHTCHVCNSTYSEKVDLETHMWRVHGLEKISWSMKDKAGHRCVVCNSPYKNLKDLEFHVKQFHGVGTGHNAALAAPPAVHDRASSIDSQHTHAVDNTTRPANDAVSGGDMGSEPATPVANDAD